MIATVEYDTGMVWVEVGYDAEMIQQLKDEIPPGGRTWNVARKVWGFTPDWWDAARRVIMEYAEILD